jgi:hypothetical protein
MGFLKVGIVVGVVWAPGLSGAGAVGKRLGPVTIAFFAALVANPVMRALSLTWVLPESSHA